MSMISSLIDELNKSADEWNRSNLFELARMCRDAADTIWQLRDDLQRANDAVRDAEHDESRAWDRVRKAEAENAKLRELVDKLLYGIDHDVTPADALVWTQEVYGHRKSIQCCASWGWTMREWEEIKREAEALMERYQREMSRKPDAWEWLKTYFIRLGGRKNG